MMVPRSYLYTHPPSPPGRASEKEASSVQVREHKPKTAAWKAKALPTARPAWMASAPPATPSKPMIIPARTHNGGARRGKESSPKARNAQKDDSCDLDLAPPPLTASRQISTTPQDPRVEVEKTTSYRWNGRSQKKHAREESLGAGRRTVSASSPHSWGLLLSPPGELDLESSSVGSDTTIEGGYCVRSLSSDSLPSLDTHYGSSPSPNGAPTPRTPSGSRIVKDREVKEDSSLSAEECLDHPLLSLLSTENADALAIDFEREPQKSPEPLGRRSSFKSNLTASLALLRSAARSFSNFGAQAVSRDEYLTRSLLPISPPFTDERRPSPSPRPPDPALRRYLNPITASPAEFHSHHEHISSQKASNRCTASIQLQTYQRAPRLSTTASAPPIFTSSLSTDAAVAAAANESLLALSPRQREPRENGDFLRVIVMEMNMRRSGTLSDMAPGKARMWLPARQVGQKEEDREENGVPRRWIGEMR